jgi:hypothetical protein
MAPRHLQPSWLIARRLLGLEARKESGGGGRIRTFPALLGLTNLLLCGFLDRYLRTDVDGSYLSLFFFAQASLLVLLSVGSFMRSGGEIIEKTAIFPMTPLSRWLFVFSANLRRPASAALWLTSSLFLVVFYFPRWPLALVAVALFILMVVNVEMLIALLTLWLKRTAKPVQGLVVVSVLVAILLPLGSLILHEHALLRSIPLVSTVAGGIAAMNAGQSADTARSALGLLGSTIIWYVLGRFLA